MRGEGEEAEEAEEGEGGMKALPLLFDGEAEEETVRVGIVVDGGGVLEAIGELFEDLIAGKIMELQERFYCDELGDAFAEPGGLRVIPWVETHIFAIEEVEEFVCEEYASIGGARGSLFAHLKDDAVRACETVFVVGIERCIENENGNVFRRFLGDFLLVMMEDLRDFALEDGEREARRGIGKEGKDLAVCIGDGDGGGV